MSHKIWLEAESVDKEVFNQILAGTPQGDIISPLLSNIALDGLEKELRIRYRKNSDSKKPSGIRWVLADYQKKSDKHPLRGFVIYADDFVVLCETETDCNEAKK